MKKQIRTMDIKLIPIGNSKGIRIPKALIQKYGLSNPLLLEETNKGLLLRNKKDNKLSFEDTYKAMANEKVEKTNRQIIKYQSCPITQAHYRYVRRIAKREISVCKTTPNGCCPLSMFFRLSKDMRQKNGPNLW